MASIVSAIGEAGEQDYRVKERFGGVVHRLMDERLVPENREELKEVLRSGSWKKEVGEREGECVVM